MQEFRIVTADKKHYVATITQRNYKKLLESTPADSFVLFYNGKNLSYYKRRRYTELPLKDEPYSSKEICIASKFSRNPEVIRRCRDKRDVPWLYPVSVSTLSTVRLKEEFSLHQNTLVRHIHQKIFKIYSIPIELQELYHKGRRLENDEFLVDLFFAQDEFVSKVTLIITFKSQTHKQIELFNRTYDITFQQITLKSLTGETLVDNVTNNIESVLDLKKFIYKNRRIPIIQLTLLHQGTVLIDSEWLIHRLMLEDISISKTGNLTISLIVQPCYVNVKFTSDYLEIPGDGYIKFSAMTTVKAMRVRIADVTSSPLERVALIPFYNLDGMNIVDVRYEEELMLDELNISHNPIIKVVRSICVKVGGDNQFEYLIGYANENIEQMRKELEISHGFKKRNYTLVLQNKLNKNARLLEIANDEVLRFKAKENKSCALM